MQKYQKRNRPTLPGLPDPEWPKIFRKDLSSRGTGFKWKEICALELASDSISLNPTEQILGLFHWSGCSSVTSVQDVTESVTGIFLYSSQLSCCAAAIFIFAAVSHLGVICSEQDWHKLQSYHFFKEFFLKLCFTLAFLQQWPQMIVFSHRLRDSARGISKMWNLNTWSPQFMD